jgi:hypothetical protein
LRGDSELKVVQAAGWFYPDSLGGTERYVAAVSQRLRAGGHAVAVAAPDPRTATPYEYEYDGLQVFRYPIPGRPTRDEAQGRRRARGVEHFDDWLARFRPDVFHAHTFVTGLGLHELLAARRAGARTIVTTHSASLGYTCQRGTMIRNGSGVCDGIVEPRKCAECALQQRGVGRSLSRAVARLPAALSRAGGAIPSAPASGCVHSSTTTARASANCCMSSIGLSC